MNENILAKIYLSIVFSGLGFLSLFLIFQFGIKKKNYINSKFQADKGQLIFRQNFPDNVMQGQKQSYYDQNMLALKIKFESGIRYLNLKNYKKALDNFKYCLKQWNKADTIGLIYLFNQLGYIYYELGKNSQAIYYFEASLNLTPDNVYILKNLANLYQEIGSLNQLKKIYQDLSKIAPQDEKTQQLEKYLKKRFENSE